MHKLIKFLTFNIIGLMMTLLTLILYYILNEYMALYYIVSNIISYIIPVIISFFLNENYTFKVKSSYKKRLKKLSVYIFMKLSILLVDTFLLLLWVSVFKVDKYYGKLINTVLLTIVSYSLSRKIIETD